MSGLLWSMYSLNRVAFYTVIRIEVRNIETVFIIIIISSSSTF